MTTSNLKDERAALAAALEAGSYTHSSSNTEKHRAFKDGWKQAMAFARATQASEVEQAPAQKTFGLTLGEIEACSTDPEILRALACLHDEIAEQADTMDDEKRCAYHATRASELHTKADKEQREMIDRGDLFAPTAEQDKRNSEQEPAYSWLPIKTAPRDGSNILIRFGRDGVSQAKYVPGVPHPWKFIDTNDGITWLINGARDDEYGPSHWMPMPSATEPEHGLPALAATAQSEGES